MAVSPQPRERDGKFGEKPDVGLSRRMSAVLNEALGHDGSIPQGGDLTDVDPAAVATLSEVETLPAAALVLGTDTLTETAEGILALGKAAPAHLLYEAQLTLEAKADPDWNPKLHPRDGNGRFIEVGAILNLLGAVGGGRGTVVGNGPNNHVTIRKEDGTTVDVPADQTYADGANAPTFGKPGKPGAPGKPGTFGTNKPKEPKPKPDEPDSDRLLPADLPDTPDELFRALYSNRAVGKDSNRAAMNAAASSIGATGDGTELGRALGQRVSDQETADRISATMDSIDKVADELDAQGITVQTAGGVKLSDYLRDYAAAFREVHTGRTEVTENPDVPVKPDGVLSVDGVDVATVQHTDLVSDHAVDEGMGGEPTADIPESVGERFSKIKAKGRVDGAGTVEDPIDVEGDLDKALELLADGKHVRLNQPDEVATLLDKLAEQVNAAKEAGDDAPDVDLCKVTVTDTSLFCHESKGIARVDMPQLSGQAMPDTPAAAKADEDGQANIEAEFRQALLDQGVSITPKTVLASHLRATQDNLDGPKVAGMSKAMEEGKVRDSAIFVTRDGYVVDGHHRWASKVAIDVRDGKVGDIEMPVEVIDMDIGEVIDYANAFAEEMGIRPKGLGAAAEGAVDAEPPNPDPRGVTAAQDAMYAITDLAYDGVYKQDSGQGIPEGVTLWRVKLPDGQNTWLTVDENGNRLELGRTRADVLDKTEWMLETLQGRTVTEGILDDTISPHPDPDSFTRGKPPEAPGEPPPPPVVGDRVKLSKPKVTGRVTAVNDDGTVDVVYRATSGRSNRMITVPADATTPAEPLVSEHAVEKPEAIEYSGETFTKADSLYEHMIPDGEGGWTLTPERRALHDDIVSRTLEGVPESSDPTVFMLGGGPAAGKSSMLGHEALVGVPDDNGELDGERVAAVVNPDNVKEVLPEYNDMKQRGESKGAAGYVHEESSIIAKRIQAVALAAKRDVVLDGTGDSHLDKLLKKIRKARDAGYKVRGFYATVPTDVAWERADTRAQLEGRYVAEPIVRGTHAAVSRVAPLAAAEFDDFTLFDTTDSRTVGPIPIARTTRDSDIEVLDEERYGAFLDKAFEGSDEPIGTLQTRLESATSPALRASLQRQIDALQAAQGGSE